MSVSLRDSRPNRDGIRLLTSNSDRLQQLLLISIWSRGVT